MRSLVQNRSMPREKSSNHRWITCSTKSSLYDRQHILNLSHCRLPAGAPTVSHQGEWKILTSILSQEMIQTSFRSSLKSWWSTKIQFLCDTFELIVDCMVAVQWCCHLLRLHGDNPRASHVVVVVPWIVDAGKVSWLSKQLHRSAAFRTCQRTSRRRLVMVVVPQSEPQCTLHIAIFKA